MTPIRPFPFLYPSNPKGQALSAGRRRACLSWVGLSRGNLPPSTEGALEAESTRRKHASSETTHDTLWEERAVAIAEVLEDRLDPIDRSKAKERN